MPIFSVVTEETVEGKYLVEAESQEEAEAKFKGAPPIKWNNVEQTSYSAFSVSVKQAEQV